MVLDIWTSDAPYDLHGEFFNVTTAKTMIPEIGQGTILKPYQKPHPPIVVTAVAPHSKGVTEAAKRGWTPISANFLLPEWVASHWPRYVEGCDRVGARRRSGGLARRQIASSSPTTRPPRSATAIGPKGPYHFYFKQLIASWSAPAGAEPVQARPERARRRHHGRRVTRKLVIAGTVDSVVEQILAFRDEIGDFGTLLMPATTGWTRRSARARCS